MPLPRNVADWPKQWRELYEERAGIMEFLGNISRAHAEGMAEYDIRRSYEKQEKEASAAIFLGLFR